MKTPSSRYANFILLVCELLGVGVLFFFLYFQSALSQEKDNLDILKAALRIELTPTELALVKGKPQRLLVKGSSDALETYLSDKGWTFVSQTGAHVVYGKGDQELYPNCENYSKRYAICDLSQIP